MQVFYRILSNIITPFVNGWNPPGVRDLWFHAASVGEVVAISPLVEKYLNANPEGNVLLTVMTQTGVKKAKSLLGESVTVRRFPLDSPKYLKNLLDMGRPRALIIVETELWPNMILEASKRKIPLILVNGRMQSRSFTAYKLFRREVGSLLNKFELLLLQTEVDKKRFVRLGAPEERIRVMGSLKYDVEPLREIRLNKEDLGYGVDDVIMIFGSIRSKEENFVIETILRLKEHRDLKFILAPRHLIRAKAIGMKLKRKGISFVERTKNQGKAERVLVLDTVGELVDFYSICDIAFVGGSLAPYGGHNLLEPASLGKPVIFGKYTFNTDDAAHGLVRSGGGIQINEPHELAEAIESLFFDPEKRVEMGMRARAFLQSRKGVVDRVFEEIKPIITA